MNLVIEKSNMTVVIEKEQYELSNRKRAIILLLFLSKKFEKILSCL
jgi:hypothetical protein